MERSQGANPSEAQQGAKCSNQQLKEKGINAHAPDFDPTSMAEEQRIIYLMRYTTEILRGAYSIAVGAKGHSAFSKADYISGLARSSNWPVVFRLLHFQEPQTSVPDWPIESSIAAPTTDTEASPWAQFLVRDIGGPYKDGRDFLSKWGISLETPTQTIGQLRYKISNPALFEFVIQWRDFNVPEDEIFSLQPELDKFFLDLPIGVREGLPTNFPKKAAMIWDLLVTHAKESSEWTELDKEVKWYAALHHFFADLPQVADKQLMCKPPGAKYERLQLYPDLLISVPTKTAGLNVPAVIVENGAEEAGFDVHKDSVKVLAETRMATTFSLSKCEIKDAFCYGIVNGGSKMSVTLNNVTLELQGGSTEHIQQQQSKIKSRRLYQSSFILPTQQQDPARQLFSVEYNKANYKDIILVLVTIFCHISIMRTWKARKETLSFTTHQSTPQKPDVDGFGKTKKQDKPDGKRDGGNEEKKGGDDKGKGSSNPSTNYSGPPLRKHSTIMIGSEKCVVTDVVSAKALILKQCNRNKSYFAKVCRISEDGTLPFEYQLLLSLDHPNILKPVNWIRGQSDSEYLMIMPLKSPAHIELRRSAFDNTSTVYGVLEALCYLHGRGIVHADVKSDNVVVELKSTDWDSTGTYGFKPYLIDFDSSFFADNPPKGARGTKVYIAPEVWEGSLTPAMDMWSWGVFVFNTFFGLNDVARAPDLRSAIAKRQEHLLSYPIVELLFDLIWKCLELDPAKRITAEQAKEHNFFYAMKHIKPSIITLYVLGNHLDLDDDSWELSEEETRSSPANNDHEISLEVERHKNAVAKHYQRPSC